MPLTVTNALPAIHRTSRHYIYTTFLLYFSTLRVMSLPSRYIFTLTLPEIFCPDMAALTAS